MRKVLLLGIVLLSSLGACVERKDPVTGRTEMTSYSDADEIRIGESAAPSMESQSGGLYKDPALQAYVSSVGARIAAASDRKGMPCRYAVLNSSIVNAFALPGGRVYISRGLLARLKAENELAAVLGHETGHVAARHSIRQLESAMKTQFAFSIADLLLTRGENPARGAKEGLETAKLVAGLGRLKFSRDDERQADHLGIVYADRAGWDARGMTGLLEILKATEEREPSAVEGLFRTHPLSSERIQNARSELGRRDPAAMDARTRTTPEFERHAAAVRDAEKAYALNDTARDRLAKAQSAGAGERPALLRQALDLANQAVQAAPRQAPLYATRAWVQTLLASDRRAPPSEALADAEHAAALDADLFEGHLLAGVARLNLGNLPGAREALGRADALWPDHPAPHYYLGLTAQRDGRRDEAARHYARAQELDPEGGYGRMAGEALGRPGGR